MSENTKIEWCDRTWSPWEGCTKISPACDHCYASARNARFSRGANWGPGAPRRLTADWTKPALWNRQAAKAGKRISVFPSICDPFDNEVSPEWRGRFYELCNSTPHLTWLLLTKRISNVMAMAWMGPFTTLPNVWIGATVVNQEEADRDIPKLLEVPARVRFLSIEPMLGAIDLRPYLIGHEEAGTPFDGARTVGGCKSWTPPVDWVIAGGESGPGARAAHPDWFRSLRDQCAAAGVPFLFKQWGEWLGAMQDGDPERDPTHINASSEPIRIGKKAAGRLLDGVEHNGFPEAQA